MLHLCFFVMLATSMIFFFFFLFSLGLLPVIASNIPDQETDYTDFHWRIVCPEPPCLR